jgi:hypothetical protein
MVEIYPTVLPKVKLRGGEYLGGLVGYNSKGIIINSYTTVDVYSMYFNFRTGGLVGSTSGGSIIRCYAAGSLSVKDEEPFLGGLVGEHFMEEPVSIIDCFWNTEISGIYTSEGGMGLTTTQMMDPNIYSLNGWGGDPNWVLNAGKDYPRLAWEGRPGQTIPEPNIDWLDGSGTPEYPYIIADVNQFARIGTASILWDKSFILTSDLDLTGINIARIGVCQGTDFTGTFDGGNHIISNLTIGSDLILEYSLGLFGYIGPKGCVSRLKINSATIKGGSNSENVGIMAGVNKGTITDSCVTGSVSIGHYYFYVGGMAGKNQGSITNCYSTASVSGGIYGNYLGGLVGGNGSQISHCYATGSVTSGEKSRAFGGLIGNNWNGGIIGCFWDIETSGINFSDGGTGLNTEQMKAASTFFDAGWDFDNIWMICEGKDYPRLQWENVQCESE